MNNEMINKPPFKVKCVNIEIKYLTVGKEYVVREVDDDFYKVRNDCGMFWWYHYSRFELVETLPKDKQELSVGDKVVINKISDDIATVTMIENYGYYDIRLKNPNWKKAWWFSKADVSFVDGDNSLDYHLLSPQEVVQATLDGKEVEVQHTDGTWHRFSTYSATLYQLINLNFRLKPSLSLEEKRKAIIKKLLTTKVAVLCKCWDDDGDGTNVIEAITRIDDDCTYHYMNNEVAYGHAYAIDDNGNEITNV